MDPESRLVAIVDDDPSVCRALARLVRSLGFDATTYGSGEELLTGAMETTHEDILLDLHLPGLRGAALVATIRSRLAARVVVMTGLDRPGAREACLNAGAIAYLTKPVRREELADILGAARSIRTVVSETQKPLHRKLFDCDSASAETILLPITLAMMT